MITVAFRDGKTVEIEQAVLERASPVFQSMFQHGLLEKTMRVLNMEHFHPAPAKWVFRHIHHWPEVKAQSVPVYEYVAEIVHCYQLKAFMFCLVRRVREPNPFILESVKELPEVKYWHDLQDRVSDAMNVQDRLVWNNTKERKMIKMERNGINLLGVAFEIVRDLLGRRTHVWPLYGGMTGNRWTVVEFSERARGLIREVYDATEKWEISDKRWRKMIKGVATSK